MTEQPQQTDQSEFQRLNSAIAVYEREFKKWEGRVEKILKRYRDEMRDGRRGYTEARYNILWANVQTLRAATFARLPKPDVSRRFRDNDPVGRVASLILERALDYEISHYDDYRDTLVADLYDRFLGGRGSAWIRYEPKFTPIGNGLDYDGDEVTEDVHLEGEAEAQEAEVLDYECAPCDYVHWKDFGHSVARTWEEVTMVWRRVYMTKTAVRERFPDWADQIPFDARPDDKKGQMNDGANDSNNGMRAVIYEIWDKETGDAYWVSKSLGKIIDIKQDPLQLEGFFPCPRPLYATITNESLVPVPDYTLYQDQANELDVLCDRIDGLTKSLKVMGVYDASQGDLQRLFSEADNTNLIPVNNWNSFAEKAGLKGAIDLVDIQPIAFALTQAYTAMQQIKQQIYDITGISDIVRGQSVASETATAQQIKGQYASLRLKAYQDEVVRFATKMLQLKAQVICKHFDPQTILTISAADQLNPVDQQYIMPAIQMLKNEPLRSFRIEISSDSMSLADETQEKQDRIEFLTATSSFIEKAVQASQQAPEIAPLVLDLLKFGVTGFKIGKGLEGEIDQMADQMKQAIAQKQQQPPQPSPEQQKFQAEMQFKQQQLQNDQQDRAAQAQIVQQQNQLEHEREMFKAQNDKELEMMRQKFAEWQAEQEAELTMRKALLDAETKIIVAEIAANSVMSKAQDDAADAAVNDEPAEYPEISNETPQQETSEAVSGSGQDSLS